MAFLAARAAPVLRGRATVEQSRYLCIRASASADPPGGRPLSGLALLRSDLHRLSRLARCDFSALASAQPEFPTYDAETICSYFDARPVRAASRFARVAVPFGLWLAKARFVDRLTRRDAADARADELRRILVWAGPAYLKIGQAVGNRPDIVGVTYARALQRLVDNVGAFDDAQARAIVCEQLGVGNIADVFPEFAEASASASLGQVHRARLASGEEVAVKVQRPSLKKNVAIDMYVLRKAAALVKSRFKLRSDLVGIVDEFGSTLWEELDYRMEADNCDKFRRLYADGSDDIVVPKIYRDFSSERVLTMEWIDGDKPPWFPKEDALRLINIGVQCSLQQLLQYGVAHADPHVGNLLRLKSGGELVYLDFGMVSYIDEETRNNLIAAIVRLINKDYANLAGDFIKLGFLPPDVDTAPIAPLLEKAFGDASEGGTVANLSFGKLADNLTGLAFATPIRIPVFFTLVIRALAIMEGIALQTDADFKIVDQAYPFVVRRVLTDDSPVLQSALRDVLIDPKTQRIRWSRLQSILSTEGETDDPKARRDKQDSALADVSDEALKRVLDFALSERGAFLRDALQREAADTVDAFQLAVGHRLSALSGGVLPPPVDPVDKGRVEAGIAVAEALRERAPQLLQLRSQADAGDARRRQQRLSAQLKDSSRAVFADIVDRNSRRFFRQVMRFILGDKA